MAEMPNGGQPAKPAGDTAGVIAPPPLLAAGFLLLGYVFDLAWPAALLPAPLQYVIGGALILPALVLAASGVLRFRRAGTHVEPYKPTTALVTDGPYRWSRNPIYLALALAGAGIALAVDSAWMLASILPFVLVLRYGVVAREERYLERKFGQAYLDYKASVRRWL